MAGRRSLLAATVLLTALAMAGCLNGPRYAPPPGALPAAPGETVPLYPPGMVQANPTVIPVQDPNLLWDQLVDVVDDYFDIEREDRVRIVGGVVTDGRIETFPKGSSTILEPWNADSVTPYERWEATLQSTRRQAMIRVMPVEGGYSVDVHVLKELEDVQSPDFVIVSDNDSLRNDNSYRRFSNSQSGGGRSLGWIGKGRDVALEQEIILQLQARFQVPGAGPAPMIIGTTSHDVPASTAQWQRPGAEAKTR